MDLSALFRLKTNISNFKRNHPRVVAFLGDAGRQLDEGSIVEVAITTSDGRKMTSNMKVSRSDLELLKTVGEVIKQ